MGTPSAGINQRATNRVRVSRHAPQWTSGMRFLAAPGHWYAMQIGRISFHPSQELTGARSCRVSVAMRVAVRSYAAELSLDVLDEDGSLLDWVIGFVFDTLEAPS